MSDTSINVYNILLDSLKKNSSSIWSIIPLFIGYYLQDIVFTKNIASVTSNVPKFVDDITFGKLLVVVLPYGIALMLFYISNILTVSSVPKAEFEALQEVTDQLIESIKLSKESVNTNDLIVHLKKIADTKEIYKMFISYILPTIIVIIGIIYYFLKCDISTSIIVILIIIIFVIITINFELHNINETYHTEESINELFEDLHDILINVDTVITSDAKKKEMKNICVSKEKTFNRSHSSALTNINVSYGLEIFNMLVTLGINYLAYRLYINNTMDTSTFISVVILTIVFMDYYRYLLHEIMDFVVLMGRLYDANSYFSNFKFIENNGESDKQKLLVTKGNILFKDITFKYDDMYIFNNFNLYIPGGKKIGLIGPIGSGKTTLLKMLINRNKYDGTIYIDSQDMSKCSLESITSQIAYIPQQPKLFNKTIMYNINYNTNYNEQELIEKLNSLGLMTFIDSFPNKLQSIVGKEGTQLSGGQKQLIVLIRVLLQNKSIILLDEPTSSLDQTNKLTFVNIINKIKNKTIIMSTHDNQMMEIFDMIININDKKINK